MDLLYLLKFGSFLWNRLSIKPQMINGKCGGRDELRTQGRETEEGEFPWTENLCPSQCLYLPWTVCTVKYSRFAGSALVEWLFPSIFSGEKRKPRAAGQISCGKDTLCGSPLPPMAGKSPQMLESQNFHCGYFI